MVVGPHLVSWILVTFFVEIAGTSLRSDSSFSVPAEDGRPVSNGTPTDEKGRYDHFSALATSASAGRVDTAFNPFAWLFGRAPTESMPVIQNPISAPVGNQSAQSPVPQLVAPSVAVTMPANAAVVHPPATEPSPSSLVPQPPQRSSLPVLTLTAMKARQSQYQMPSASVSPEEVAQLREQIASLRSEVVSGQKDMFDVAKMIASSVEKTEKEMEALTQDVQTLRGRHAGSVPVVTTECSVRQSSCSECLSIPTCVWCKVEQRCYSGDKLGPLRGECAFFRHGQCS